MKNGQILVVEDDEFIADLPGMPISTSIRSAPSTRMGGAS